MLNFSKINCITDRNNILHFIINHKIQLYNKIQSISSNSFEVMSKILKMWCRCISQVWIFLLNWLLFLTQFIILFFAFQSISAIQNWINAFYYFLQFLNTQSLFDRKVVVCCKTSNAQMLTSQIEKCRSPYWQSNESTGTTFQMISLRRYYLS